VNLLAQNVMSPGNW